MDLIYGLLYVLFAPFLGCLIKGFDRVLTARMQGRVGPPLLQPFYDVMKHFEKEKVVVTNIQNIFVLGYLIFTVFTGAIFFAGGDLLLAIFAMTLAHVFLVLGAYSTNSPYSFIGAERELVQMMAFEPAIVLVAAGFYLATGSFYVADIVKDPRPLVLLLPGLLLSLLFLLTLKLRKSPFDLSTSHHAHQEIVKGVTTEFTGSTFGRIELAEWYETVFILGFIYLFFAFNPILAFLIVAGTYLLEIFIDNSYPRLKIGTVLKSSWVITVALSVTNLVILWYFTGGGPG